MSSGKCSVRDLQRIPEPSKQWIPGESVRYCSESGYIWGTVVKLYAKFILIHFDIGYNMCFSYFSAERKLQKYVNLNKGADLK